MTVPLIRSLGSASAVALVCLASSESRPASAQIIQYINQEPIQRAPDDVVVTPGGTLAVVRGVERTIFTSPQPHVDEIVVIRMTDGQKAPFPPLDCTNHALTETEGASDLVAVTNFRAVLLGQQHFGASSGWKTCVDIVDLSDVYGLSGQPRCMLNWERVGTGHASDLAITPDESFAVVNHKNYIAVFDIQNEPLPPPIEFFIGPTEPAFLRDSVAMTRNTDPLAPIKAVVLTARTVGQNVRTWVHILDLSTGTIALETSQELDVSNPLVSHPPHDLAITPDDRLAVVVAGDLVALFDLTVDPAVTPALIGEYATSGVTRSYNHQADSLEVTNSQAVVIGATGGDAGWRADVFDISPASGTGLVHKKTETGPSYPHDLAINPAGKKAVIRTMQHMVVLANIDQAGTSIVRTDVASATLFLTRHDDNSDSVVVSSAWVVPIQQGQTGSGLRQYAVAYAGHSATVSRVDFVDLTTNPPVLVHTEFQQDSSYSGVRPTTIQLAGGGRRVVLRCSAAPHEDFSTNPSINPATGEDVWYFSLDDPIQSLFQYEISGVPQAASDPLAVSRFRAVNVSNHFFGNDGYVHTIEIQ